MRYWKGSIALSSTQDYPLLRRVLRSTFVTHRQLYDFMRLEYRTWSRHSFNNRVLRLVKHNYLVRDDVPFKTDGYVYSISGMGALEVIGLGECYTSPTPRTKDGKLPRSVYHAIDLNEIHLALKRSAILVDWISDTEIRSQNELTSVCYCKDYDAVVTVRVAGTERKFALEYERSPKTGKTTCASAPRLTAKSWLTASCIWLPATTCCRSWFGPSRVPDAQYTLVSCGISSTVASTHHCGLFAREPS